MTECSSSSPPLHALGCRRVIASFDGGTISTDGGAILLRELELRTGIIASFARCFVDHRDPDLIEHSVLDLVSQRVLGLVLGYEDLIDHDTLRADPLLALAVGKTDADGAQRLRQRDKGNPLAGKSTLNRLELTPPGATRAARYKKIVADCGNIEKVFVERFIAAHPVAPKRIVLDLDATDDPVHGNQVGRFFHGYYGHYCFLPLYIFAGRHLLCAKLRAANVDASFGATGELHKIVTALRAAWPGTKIIIRGDSGFCREPIMAWCEQNRVDYVLGLAKNNRLLALLSDPMQQAKERFEQTGQPCRFFGEFQYQTLESWSRPRRTIGKAEHLTGGPNPRFIVTSLSREEWAAQTLYEQHYCARGEMENRIKEQQLYLFADRTSAQSLRANQLRLWLSAFAYTVLVALQDHLAGTALHNARCDTIRLKLLKVATQVKVTVRNVWLSISEAYPYRQLFEKALNSICQLPLMARQC
jgi:hypothetical protein